MTSNPLPVRRTPTRRTGRHRSPHSLSLPPEAPELVLAVPGSATPESAATIAEISMAALASSQVIKVRAGYLEGRQDSLDDLLTGLSGLPGNSVEVPSAVVVPLLIGADPAREGSIEASVRKAGPQAALAERLGPHPLIAEALHARLAEAGLAQPDRMRELQLASGPGVLVLTASGREDAELAGMLLASRLGTPVAGAALDHAGAMEDAQVRLRESGISGPAVAPAIIGPEMDTSALPEIARRAGAAGAAPPLGAHPAIAQLVVMRYGAVLTRWT